MSDFFSDKKLSNPYHTYAIWIVIPFWREASPARDPLLLHLQSRRYHLPLRMNSAAPVDNICNMYNKYVSAALVFY